MDLNANILPKNNQYSVVITHMPLQTEGLNLTLNLDITKNDYREKDVLIL